MPVLLLALLLAGPVEQPPRLVVIVCADQFRADYLERFEPLFPEGGLRRLMEGGAVFANAEAVHTAAGEAPGHAAIATGCLPGRAGIPTDHWFDRETREHERAVQDRACYAVGSDEMIRIGHASPRPLERPTLGDVMTGAFGEASLVVSIGWRDTGAILLGGIESDGSYWVDRSTGTWVTTSVVRGRLPDWLVDHNEGDYGAIHRYRGRTWRRSFTDEDGLEFAGPDDDPAEPNLAGFPVFPYQMPPYIDAPRRFRKRIEKTPFGDMAVRDVVLLALEHEALGRDETPDLLCVSFDALDLTGDDYGPRSQEVMDVVLNLDLRLAELMDALDARVGEGRWTLAFASGHGVAPLPGHSGGARLSTHDLIVPVELGLRDAYAQLEIRDLRSWTLGLGFPWIYLSEDVAARAGADLDEVATKAAEIVAGVPGVERALTRSQLRAEAAHDPRLAPWAADLHPTRSGDVLILLERDAVVNAGVGTSHASHHDYDRRVPLMFYGAGIAPGVHDGPATPMDVAPTLARLLDVELPDADGRVLAPALAGRP